MKRNKYIYWDEGNCYEMLIVRSEGRIFSVFISAEDFHRVQKYQWYVQRRHSNSKTDRHWYARTESCGKILLHRFIMEPLPGMVIDHIDGDTLNNRRENLRISTHKENGNNRRGNKHGGKENDCKTNNRQ